jgi:hypothetical protein
MKKPAKTTLTPITKMTVLPGSEDKWESDLTTKNKRKIDQVVKIKERSEDLIWQTKEEIKIETQNQPNPNQAGPRRKATLLKKALLVYPTAAVAPPQWWHKWWWWVHRYVRWML